MCGISGYSGKAKGHNIDKLKILIMDNESRGSHSSGIYGRQLFKDNKKSSEFVRDINFKNAGKHYEVVMHTRYATTGEKTKENAHPFHYGEIYGTHNGVIHNYRDVAKDNKLEVPSVDSEIIWARLAQANYDWKVIAECRGTMALAFVYQDQLHLYRRNNPLFIGRLNDGLYYSSLQSSLEMINCRGIAALDTDKLFVFKRGVLVNTIDVPEPEKEVYQTTGNYGRQTSWADTDYYSGRNSAWNKNHGWNRKGSSHSDPHLSVMIKNLITGQPISGAEIFLDDDMVMETSGATGSIFVANISPGIHTVTLQGEIPVTGSNESMSTGQFKLEPNATYRLVIYVDPTNSLKAKYDFGKTWDRIGNVSTTSDADAEPGNNEMRSLEEAAKEEASKKKSKKERKAERRASKPILIGPHTSQQDTEKDTTTINGEEKEFDYGSMSLTDVEEEEVEAEDVTYRRAKSTSTEDLISNRVTLLTIRKSYLDKFIQKAKAELLETSSGEDFKDLLKGHIDEFETLKAKIDFNISNATTPQTK